MRYDMACRSISDGREYIVVDIPVEDRSRMEEILTAVQQPERGYDHASIKGAVVKEKGEWKSFITKITLKRRKIGKIIPGPLKIVLQRSNFLIFHYNVNVKKLIKILEDLVGKKQFTIDNYVIQSGGRFARGMFFSSSREPEMLDWPADAYPYRVREHRPDIPDDLRLERDSFLDIYHAIRELVGFKRLDDGYYSRETVLVLLPYYFAKISKCEIQGEKLILELEPYDETISLGDLRITYIYGREYRGEDSGEISPVQWNNEATLDYVPRFVHAYLFTKGFEDRIDEYYLYREAGRAWPEAVTGIDMTLPDMFKELEAVLGNAGFTDAKAKIVLAAATNLMEVVVTKKLIDLDAKITGNLNDKISRVVREIEKKENRSITEELIAYVIKVTRDKVDHAGFKLYVREEDAVFMLKRTIDFLRQLYT